jgi:protein involved in sex pheromone biosynthesis
LKNIIRKASLIALAMLSVLVLSACAPEVGSEQWCKDMKAKPKGDWTANQAMDFAKHCVMK